MKNFDKNLKIKIKNLPLHHPEPAVWDKISHRLDFNDKIDKEIRFIPMHEPLEDTWSKIEPLLKPGLKVSKSRNLIIGLISVAASVILFFSLWFIKYQSSHETITVSVETVESWNPVALNEDSTSQTALRFINKQCEVKSYICSNPGFAEKKKQLEEVETQIRTIKNIMNSLGSTPSLIKSNIKLENLRTRLMKDLLNIISS
jgi:hypothetical protein